MTATEATPRAGEDDTDRASEHKVTPLELFFDLVFVLAITQVTALMAADPSAQGLLRGMAALAVIWWAWGGYAWLTNAVEPEATPVRLTIFAGMAAMLVVALAVPHAFDDDKVVFAGAYLAVRLLHQGLFHIATRGDEAQHGAVLRLMPAFTLAPALLLAAAFTDGTLFVVLWAVALTVDYGGPVLSGMEGWRIHPEHFAERHGLILIIALGESIVAIGIGAEGIEVGPGIIAAAALGIAAVCCLWWSYFDVVAPTALRKLTEATGGARVVMARDSYSYLHLPMIAGIVLFALGTKKTLEHVEDPLKWVPAIGLYGGPALFLLSLVVLRLRNVRTVNRQRLVMAVVLAALVPLGHEIAALASLALVAALLSALIAYEVVRFREARARIRAAARA